MQECPRHHFSEVLYAFRNHHACDGPRRAGPWRTSTNLKLIGQSRCVRLTYKFLIFPSLIFVF